MPTHLRIISVPTIVIAPPVAHGGIDEKMGPKKMEMKNIIPVVMAVSPVLPPSTKIIYQPLSTQRTWYGPLIPVADSMNTVTELEPKRALRMIEKAVTQNAIEEPSKSRVAESCKPDNLAMVERVLESC